MNPLSGREFSPFYVMELVRQAQEYEDVVHFEIGAPDLPPPPGVRRALQKAVESGAFGYTESRGLEELRRKIAEHYGRRYDLDLDPARVIVTPGSSLAFLIAYEMLAGPGDRIAMADPSYPCYKNFAAMVDAQPHFVEVGAEQGYLLDPRSLEGVSRLRAVHISTPSNPTGTLYPPERLRALALWCRERGVALISDELYHGLVYDQREHTALEYSDEAIVINGFSKSFCMPGLRLGWMVVPPGMVRMAEILAQNLYLSAPTLSQYAALEAFDYDYLEEVRQTFRRRRDWLHGELSQILPVSAPPDGAFYLWCDASGYCDDARRLSEELLRQVQVAVTPGIDFGRNGTKRALRFAYTRPIEEMEEGIARLRRFFS